MRDVVQKRIENASEKQINLNELKLTDQELPNVFADIKKRWPNSESTFEIINLSSNNITDKGANFLSKELTTFKKLTFLDLQNNQINKKGFNDLLELRHINRKLNTKLALALYGNLYCDAGEIVTMEKKIEDKN